MAEQLQTIPDIEASYLFITNETYQLLKKYVVLCEAEDQLNKSYDDRVLDLLLEIFEPSVYRMYRLFGKDAKDLEYSHDLITLYLRPQTYAYLKIYTMLINKFNTSIQEINAALFNLLEKGINTITITRLNREIAEMKEKLQKRGILKDG